MFTQVKQMFNQRSKVENVANWQMHAQAKGTCCHMEMWAECCQSFTCFLVKPDS